MTSVYRVKDRPDDEDGKPSAWFEVDGDLTMQEGIATITKRPPLYDRVSYGSIAEVSKRDIRQDPKLPDVAHLRRLQNRITEMTTRAGLPHEVWCQLSLIDSEISIALGGPRAENCSPPTAEASGCHGCGALFTNRDDLDICMRCDSCRAKRGLPPRVDR